MKLLIVVDDVFARGERVESDEFHAALEKRFECRPEARQYMSKDNPVDYCGLRFSVAENEKGDVYSIDQQVDIADFILTFGLENEKIRTTPIASIDLIASDFSIVSPDIASWYKRAVGKLNLFVQGTRWDIAFAVSLLSQFNHRPTVGAVLALKYLAGYLLYTHDFKMSGYRLRNDSITVWSDSSHNGTSKLHHISQTGTLVMLNGVPMKWRSCKQSKIADSPAAAEIFAAKDAVRDGRLSHWVAQEFGMCIPFPFDLNVDSNQTISFAGNTCAKSKLRGAIDMRMAFIQELRDDNIVRFQKVDTADNLSDIFTKCFKGPAFAKKFNNIANFQDLQLLGVDKKYSKYAYNCSTVQEPLRNNINIIICLD